MIKYGCSKCGYVGKQCIVLDVISYENDYVKIIAGCPDCKSPITKKIQPAGKKDNNEQKNNKGRFRLP